MLLPNFEDAILSIEKLRDYCLCFEHPVGKHKANIFKKKLNLTSAYSYKLKDEILKGIPAMKPLKQMQMNMERDTL